MFARMLAFMPIQILIFLSAFFPVQWTEALRYDRLALVNGEWWRVLTAPFVHLTAMHAIGNLFGASMVWFLFGKWIPAGPFRFFLLAHVALAALLWWGFPATAWYCGFSGLTYATLVGAGLGLWRGGRWVTGGGLLVATALKLTWEQWQGTGASTFWDFPVSFDSHLAGGLSGFIVLIPFLWSPRRRILTPASTS